MALHICRKCVIFNIDIFVYGDNVEQVTSADHPGYKLSTVNKKKYYG